MGSPRRAITQYANDESHMLVAIGTSPARGGCYAPIASIIANVEYYEINRSSAALAFDTYGGAFYFIVANFICG